MKTKSTLGPAIVGQETTFHQAPEPTDQSTENDYVMRKKTTQHAMMDKLIMQAVCGGGGGHMREI